MESEQTFIDVCEHVDMARNKLADAASTDCIDLCGAMPEYQFAGTCGHGKKLAWPVTQVPVMNEHVDMARKNLWSLSAPTVSTCAWQCHNNSQGTCGHGKKLAWRIFDNTLVDNTLVKM